MFDQNHLHDLRRAELDFAFRHVAIDCKTVLEIGAGDGFLARELAKRADVSAIDVETSSCGRSQFFAVQAYDGCSIPFPDRTFDIVFSCHALEHIADLRRYHGEMRRVLKKDGFGVHIVPSASWRFWSIITHYPALPKVVAAKMRMGEPTATASGKRTGPLTLFAKVLLSPRHGERGNALTEVHYFSERAWRREMILGGWKIETILPCGVFYTGYEITGAQLPMAIRRKLARLLGSSSHLIVASPL